MGSRRTWFLLWASIREYWQRFNSGLQKWGLTWRSKQWIKSYLQTSKQIGDTIKWSIILTAGHWGWWTNRSITCNASKRDSKRTPDGQRPCVWCLLCASYCSNIRTATEKSNKDANAHVARQHYTISLVQPYLFGFTQPWLKGYTGQFGAQVNHNQLLSFYLARFWIDKNVKESIGRSFH